MNSSTYYVLRKFQNIVCFILLQGHYNLFFNLLQCFLDNDSKNSLPDNLHQQKMLLSYLSCLMKQAVIANSDGYK